MDAMYQTFGRSFAAGTVLFNEGEAGQNMYVIQKGKIKIYRTVAQKETVLAILPPGEFFGEMAIINNKPRSASASVLEDADLLVLDAKTFEAMIRGNSEIAVRMIKRLADRLEQANQQIELLLHRDPSHRVVQFLRLAAQKMGVPSPAGTAVEFTEKTLAQHIGLSEEEVREVINRLERAKLVTRNLGGAFVVSEAGKLQDFLDFLELTERYGS